MKGNRKNLVAAVVVLLVIVIAIFCGLLFTTVSADLTGIKKELPAATEQLGFHYGSDHISELYQTSEVISND